MIKRDKQFVSEGGLTVLNQLKTYRSHSLPIIGVSGYRPSRYNSITALEIAKTMGISLALYKPIRPEQLQSAVKGLLDSE